MKDTVLNFLNQLKQDRRKRRKAAAVLVCLSLIVAGSTTWALHMDGEGQTGETYCNYAEEHRHDESCVGEKVLICGYDAAETSEVEFEHIHSDACYETQTVLTCAETEHTHNAENDCYDENGDLICQIPEHVHSEENGCYTTGSVLICGMEESSAESAESETELSNHVHTDECYEITYTCGYGYEHIHTLSCYSNPEADVETAEDWEKTVSGVELTGDYAADLVAVAKTQLGYTESTDNYATATDENGSEYITGGYTRYGAWYGDAYADWDALFVSFCLNYAQVPEELFPQSASAAAWVQTLSSEIYNLYHTAASGYYPEAGDLVFLDHDGDGSADRVGIVSQRVPVPEGETVTNEAEDPLASASFKAIEGDSGNQVAERTYEYTDSDILGYASLNLWGNMDGSRRAAYVNSLISHLPSFEEAQEALNAYEDAGDDEGYAAYYQALQARVNAAQVLYYELTEEQRTQVSGGDTLQTWAEMFSVQALVSETPVTVTRRNKGVEDGTSVILCTTTANQTVKQVCGTSDSWTYWTEIVIKKDSSGNLKVDNVFASGVVKSSDPVPTTDEGFILMIFGSYSNASVGDYVICSSDDLWQNTTSSTNLSGTITFSDKAPGTTKDPKDNSDELTIVQGVDTSSFITLNLYDYGDKINTNYKSDKNYPGFQQDYGASITSSSSVNGGSLNFGNNITSDMFAGINGLANAGGTINSTSQSKTYGINIPVSIAYEDTAKTATYSSPMSMTLNSDGYPQSDGNISWKYLFTADPDNGVTKVNDENITGLFQYDEETGLYTYNSRDNHAQFDAATDSFTLYDQTITSNFIFYPFGNFLPFNDIVTQAKKSSDIDADYLTAIATSANAKATAGYDNSYSTLGKTPYATLAASLNNFVTWANSNLGNKNGIWTAADATNKFLSDAKTGAGEVTNDDLSDLYTIDYDEETDFYFGMEMQMDFVQSKGGITSKGQDMILRFTGDDDVLFYIDDVLFLDLSGIHRHVGGEIDFKKGEVRYYALDATTGDVSTSAEDGTPVLTRSFSDILTTAGKTDAANALVNGTFADYTTHTVNFYYLERGSGSGVMRLEFNMEQVAPTGIYKVDQYGDAVAGATFAAYPAKKASDGTYQYLTAVNGSVINSTVSTVDPETGVITFADGTTLSPAFIGTTDITGQMIFTNDDGEAMSLSEMKQTFGEYFILREVKVPEGYRTVADESWMYFAGEVLECDNTLTSGTWASPDASVLAPTTLYKAESSSDSIEYYSYDSAGNVEKQNGTLFAVVLKKNGAGATAYDNWYPVTGNDDDGYVVSENYGVAAAIDAAKTYTDETTGSNDHVFSIGQINVEDEKGNPMTIGMVATIQELPGFPTDYYTWQYDNNENHNVSNAEYLVAYYYTTADSLAGATADNTCRVTSHGLTGEATPFTVQWSSTIEIPDVINALYFQKADESVSTLIDDAVFALYEVEAGTPNSANDEFGYYVAKAADGSAAYVRLDEDAAGKTEYGKATVYDSNFANPVTGSYTIRTDTITIPKTDGTGYITDEGAGVITVSANNTIYTITPAKNAQGQSLVGYTHDVCPTVSEEGTGHFKYLNAGYYFLKEISAPTGYILNSANVMVAVNDNGVYASAGGADNGVRVGNGPGYLVKTLDVFASVGHIDETFSWIYGVLKVDDHHNNCFEGVDELENEKSLGVNDTSYPLMPTNVTTGTGNGLTESGDPYSNTTAMVAYQQYDGQANENGTTEDSIFDYVVVSNTDHNSETVNGVNGTETLRLWTETGWSDMAIYQDTTYGRSKTDTNTVYTELSGDIANLFSSSTFVQVSDTVNIDLTVAKVTDDFYADAATENTTTVYLDGAEFTLTRYVDGSGNIVTKGTEGATAQYYDPDTDKWVDESENPPKLTSTTTFTGSNGTEYTVTSQVYAYQDDKTHHIIYTKVYTVNGQTYTLTDITDGTATLKPVTVNTDSTTGKTTTTDTGGTALTGTLARSYFKIRSLSQGTYYLTETKNPSYTTTSGTSEDFQKLSETVITISDGKYYYYEKDNNKIIVSGDAINTDPDTEEKYIELTEGENTVRYTVYEGNSFSVSIDGDDASYLVELDNKGTTAAYYEDVTGTVQMGFRVNNAVYQSVGADIQLVKVDKANDTSVTPPTSPGFTEDNRHFAVGEDTDHDGVGNYDSVTSVHNVLTGAEFKLYRLSEEEGSGGTQTKLYYKLNDDGTAEVTADEAEATVLKVDNKGYLKITGLKYTYTYYLVETKAPDGYNLLDHPIKIFWSYASLVIDDESAKLQDAVLMPYYDDQVYIVISNESGVELPYTGGTGTTLFTVGGIAILAVVTLVYGCGLRRKKERKAR